MIFLRLAAEAEQRLEQSTTKKAIISSWLSPSGGESLVAVCKRQRSIRFSVPRKIKHQWGRQRWNNNRLSNPSKVVIRPQAGRAFTLFIRGMSVFIGPHDPLRSTSAAESKQSARLCRLAQPKNRFHPAKPREPPLRQNWGFTPNPTYFFCLATEKVCKKRSSPCILADLPRLAPGTKRTRLRLKQLFVLSSASPGRCPAADARDRAAFGSLLNLKIVAEPQTALLLNRSAP